MNNRILQSMQKIREQNIPLMKYGGFGYCGYLSELLRRDLLSKNIDCDLILGSYLKNTPEGKRAKIAVSEIILSIDDNVRNEDLKYIKEHFIKRKGLLERTGHVVILVENIVYDITSDQFKEPETYPFSIFCKTWENIYKATIEIGDTNNNFGIAKITQTKYATESIDSPSWAKW